jgi:hypothetical protein
MRLSRRFIAVAFVASAAAGCSNGGSGAIVAAPPTASSPPPAPFVPAASPPHLSAACPFLAPAEIAKLLDDTAVYTSREQPPRHQGRFTVYNCAYHLADVPNTRGGTLSVGSAPSLLSPQQALQLFRKYCADDVQTLYEAAMYCMNPHNNTEIMVVKPSHGETRIAQLTLQNPPDGTMRDKYTTLIKTVEDRL